MGGISTKLALESKIEEMKSEMQMKDEELRKVIEDIRAELHLNQNIRAELQRNIDEIWEDLRIH